MSTQHQVELPIPSTPPIEPVIRYTRPDLPAEELIRPHLKAVLKSGMLSNFGPYCQRLESAVADYLHVDRVFSLPNCTTGLLIALRASVTDTTGDVILPSFTFSATPLAISWCGLTPRFVDIDPTTWTLDPTAMANAISAKTVAIMPVHTFGNPCDLDAIHRVAQGIPVIYDAASALGAIYRGRPIGSDTHSVSVFSLSGTKPITAGEGGMISVADRSLRCLIDYYRNYGFYGDYNSRVPGLNGKLSELASCLGWLNVQRAESIIVDRNQLANWYRDALAGLPLQFQEIPDGSRHTFKDFAIVLPSKKLRDALVRRLASEGIETKTYFHPVHQMALYRRRLSLPHTERIASRVVCLPMANQMTETEVGFIAAKIRRHLTLGAPRMIRQ